MAAVVVVVVAGVLAAAAGVSLGAVFEPGRTATIGAAEAAASGDCPIMGAAGFEVIAEAAAGVAGVVGMVPAMAVMVMVVGEMRETGE